MDSLEITALITQDKIDAALLLGTAVCGAMVMGPHIFRNGQSQQLVYILSVSGSYERDVRPLWQIIPGEDVWQDR